MKNKIVNGLLKAIIYGYFLVMLVVLSTDNLWLVLIGLAMLAGAAYVLREKKDDNKKEKTQVRTE